VKDNQPTSTLSPDTLVFTQGVEFSVSQPNELGFLQVQSYRQCLNQLPEILQTPEQGPAIYKTLMGFMEKSIQAWKDFYATPPSQYNKSQELSGISGASLLQTLLKEGAEPFFYHLYQFHTWPSQGIEHPAPDLQTTMEKEYKLRHAQWIEILLNHYHPDLMTSPSPASYDSHLPLKIGFLCSSGHEGIFCKLNKGIIEHLSPEKFEITIISGSDASASAISHQINPLSAEYCILPKEFEKGVRLMKKKKFDILFHFEVGTDTQNYLWPFFKLAPLQISGMGLPITSGISALTHFLTSEFLESLPTHPTSPYYSEIPLQLSQTMPVYFYPPDPPNTPKTRKDFHLPKDGTCYSCLQSLAKLQPSFDVMIKTILEKDPQGFLVLLEGQKPDWTKAIQTRFQKTLGSDLMSRIHFLPRQSVNDYFALIPLTDVMLDTTEVNGGITSLEALSFGVPVVTLPGETFRSRMTTACYLQLDVLDCVAETPEDYCQIALHLGKDPKHRKAVQEKLKTALKENHNAPLFQSPLLIQQLEKLLPEAFQALQQELKK
jgi:predicted O-linked N-acetylglucosamine transferase (SPINDLY family)